MAITGAFGAGFVKGFADDFVGRVDARTEKQDKYMDLMIENARAKAPKYAAYKAQQTQLDSLGKQLQTDFNLTKAEVEFLKGKGALQDFHKTVYEQRNAAEAVNQTYNFDKNLFFAAMNLEDRTLPMNTADRLAVAGKAYNESVSGSKNPKSEATRVMSAKNALAKLLAFNPRLGAEEAVRAMEIAGYSADELMDWDPNAPRQDLYSDIALPTTAIPVVEFTAAENKTVVSESGTKLRRLIGIEDVNGNPLDFDTNDVLGANTPKSKKTLELAALTEEGANTFAQINKRLAYQGLGNPQQLNVLSNRYSALSYFRSKIDTEQELRFLIDVEKRGLVTEFLLKNPMPTDKQLDAFFSQSAETATADVPESTASNADTPEEDTSNADTPEAAQTEAAITANQQAAITEMPNGNAVARMLAEQGKGSVIAPKDLSDIGMDRREAAYEDDTVEYLLSDIGMDRREAAYEDDSFPVSLSNALENGQAINSWVNNIEADLRPALVATGEFLDNAVANVIDFTAGVFGADEVPAISEELRKGPPPPKVIASMQDKTFEDIYNRLTEASDTPMPTEAELELKEAVDEAVREQVVKAHREKVLRLQAMNEGVRVLPENLGSDLPEDVESASPSQITQALGSLPDMPDKIVAALFDTQDKINTSIASFFEETLEERIMQNEGQRNRVVALEALKAKIAEMREEAEGEEVEPLVTRRKKPKKPKGMTSSDKARLRRAQKANELSGDSALLEMLVEKYGIALVQKEMGL